MRRQKSSSRGGRRRRRRRCWPSWRWESWGQDSRCGRWECRADCMDWRARGRGRGHAADDNEEEEGTWQLRRWAVRFPGRGSGGTWLRLIVVVVVESRMCWSIRFVSLSRSVECVRRICLRVWNLELGPLAFGGTRPAASHQLACRFPAHPLLFFMARAAEQHAYLSSSVASTPLKTACTHPQPNPASRTPQSNERIRLSCWVGGDDLPTGPPRP